MIQWCSFWHLDNHPSISIPSSDIRSIPLRFLLSPISSPLSPFIFLLFLRPSNRSLRLKRSSVLIKEQMIVRSSSLWMMRCSVLYRYLSHCFPFYSSNHCKVLFVVHHHHEHQNHQHLFPIFSSQYPSRSWSGEGRILSSPISIQRDDYCYYQYPRSNWELLVLSFFLLLFLIRIWRENEK